MRYRSVHMLTLTVALLAATACDSSTDPMPTRAEVAGDYTAAGNAGSLRLIAAGQTVDLLALGASIDLVLEANGTTHGTLILPDLDDEGPIEEDLTGTWTLSGRTVRLQHSADTFLRDISLTVQNDGSLRGSLAQSGLQVQVTLVRR